MPLQELIENFNVGWAGKDEASNFKQKCDTDIVMKESMPKIEEEITLQVDELIKVELQNLYVRLNLNKKRTKDKAPKHRKPKTKPAPGEKLVGPREPIDLMPDLIQANI